MSTPADPLIPGPTVVTVRTLFFASYRDLLGTDSLEVSVPEGATVSDVVAALRRRGGPFESLPDDPPVAVNRSWAPADTTLDDGDEVAFLPPVAGG